jgi:alpha-D-xyloside xylohydrolase
VDFWTGETLAGGKTVTANAPVNILPLYVRAGSIVPLGPVVQYAMEKPADPIEVRVYRGADGAFTLYEDEGDSYNYEKGKFATIPLEWNEAKQTLTIGKRSGSFPGMLKARDFRVVFVSPGHGSGKDAEEKADSVVHYTGKQLTVSGSK